MRLFKPVLVPHKLARAQEQFPDPGRNNLHSLRAAWRGSQGTDGAATAHLPRLTIRLVQNLDPMLSLRK